ncbi:Pyridoxal-dependent decarboxylase domain protein [Mycena sanguinolenta]|uniref:Pyridoxal-dependent decarboxylase domain protein n=1 Tax=Mycena sanguinolenta TaxID=230812 RepID=A0A8H6XHK9_9AGAR|nr:Pyridoxal-dependent decarboxylase domain protein [Mycena sanguinolenta]
MPMPALAFPGYDETLHQAVSAWFLGPRAENFGYLERILHVVLVEQFNARKAYFDKDPEFITQGIQQTGAFKEQMAKLMAGVKCLAHKFSNHHVPFWNPRYNGHMTNDTTLPGIAGYLTAMLFNPNNVAAEASPLTTQLEMEVGQQLCRMVGMNANPKVGPVGWGHITCDGSVANLESIWAARNLKFYPLSLVLAMEQGELRFISDSFKVPTCVGNEKLLHEFTTWELLNILPTDVLNIPDRLYAQYNISPAFLQNALNHFLIQSASKDSEMFEKRFPNSNLHAMAYITSATRHYSWPKGAAVTGIGSDNVIPITVDNGARMKMSDLRAMLAKCLAQKRPIYAVVAIIGSTEHGACDPLAKIYRKKGLSFVLHADAAWGAYFCTALPDPALIGGPALPYVPSIALKPEVQENLGCLHLCESVTVDPHKSGYIPYPAGGLLYRDGRMRYLVTWSSPVVNREGELNMGVYGIEGSKPGAASTATWLSHKVIGLGQRGYGALLGEAMFGCAIMYAHLSTMSTEKTRFIVTPMNMLPTEIKPGGNVEAQKKFIRDHILSHNNQTLVDDKEAMGLITEMGSDLSINAFAVNFKIGDIPNRDVISANDLNRRIFERLSIVDDKRLMSETPLFLTSTVFSQENYRDCLKSYKRRLGLNPEDPTDLYSLINVVMSPFPTQFEFTNKIIEDLTEVIKKEVQTSVEWNTTRPDFHGFIMQGTDKLFLTHIPMFNMESHRYQLIITGDLSADDMAKYVKERRDNPRQSFTLVNSKKVTLEEIVSKGSFNANVDEVLSPETCRILEEMFPKGSVSANVNQALSPEICHILEEIFPKESASANADQVLSPETYHILEEMFSKGSVSANVDQVLSPEPRRIVGGMFPKESASANADNVLSPETSRILNEIFSKGLIDVAVDQGFPPKTRRILSDVPLTNIKIIVNRRLDAVNLSRTYPADFMPFFLYGTKNQFHIDHALLASPNIVLNSDQVELFVATRSPQRTIRLSRSKTIRLCALQGLGRGCDATIPR